ncbi:MAG: hypothetical protein ABIT05_16250 [Chitinophagaceae bacterium]
MLTEEQILKSTWWADKNWPEKSITEIEQYQPASYLRLFITQQSLTAGAQKRLIDSWCKLLPTLSELNYLWFPSRVTQQMFDAACQMPNLEGLYIKWSGIQRLDLLKNNTVLKHFHLGSSSKIESITPLTGLKAIETLELEQLNKITDFSPVFTLHNLLGLGLDGSMWTTQKIDTLRGVENLNQLQYLSLANSKIKDKSFDPLLKLNNLVRFSCSWNYPEEEFDKLKALPALKYGNIQTSWKEEKSKIADIIKRKQL